MAQRVRTPRFETPQQMRNQNRQNFSFRNPERTNKPQPPPQTQNENVVDENMDDTIPEYDCGRAHLYPLNHEARCVRDLGDDVFKADDKCLFHTCIKEHHDQIINGFCTTHLRKVFNMIVLRPYANGELKYIAVANQAFENNEVLPIMPLQSFITARNSDNLGDLFYSNMCSSEVQCDFHESEKKALAMFLAVIMDERCLAQENHLGTKTHQTYWANTQKQTITKESIYTDIVMIMSDEYYKELGEIDRFKVQDWYQDATRNDKTKQVYAIVPMDFLTIMDRKIVELFTPVGSSKPETCNMYRKQNMPNVFFINGLLVMGGGSRIEYGVEPNATGPVCFTPLVLNAFTHDGNNLLFFRKSRDAKLLYDYKPGEDQSEFESCGSVCPVIRRRGA